MRTLNQHAPACDSRKPLDAIYLVGLATFSYTSTPSPHAPDHPCSPNHAIYPLTRWLGFASILISITTQSNPSRLGSLPQAVSGTIFCSRPLGNPIVTSGLISADFRGDV